MPHSKTPAPRGIALLLAALGPFSIDAYLLSFNDIWASLHATPLTKGPLLSPSAGRVGSRLDLFH